VVAGAGLSAASGTASYISFGVPSQNELNHRNSHVLRRWWYVENSGCNESCDSRGVFSRSVTRVAILSLQTRGVRDPLSRKSEDMLTGGCISQGTQSATQRRPCRSCLSIRSQTCLNNSITGKSYHLITQNVDGLSVRAHRAVFDRLTAEQQATSDTSQKAAGDLPPPNPTYVIEMHGRIHDVTCTICDARVVNFDSPICPALGEADKGLDDVTTAGSRPSAIPLDDLPKCIVAPLQPNDTRSCEGPQWVHFGRSSRGMAEGRLPAVVTSSRPLSAHQSAGQIGEVEIYHSSITDGACHIVDASMHLDDVSLVRWRRSPCRFL